MNKTVVYRHRRNDTNEIFYVGIGNEKRPYISSNRNELWNKIVLKTKYTIEILAINLSREDACDLEILLIEEYGRKDLKTGTLANLTPGGDVSTKQLKSIIFSNKNRKKTVMSKEGKLKISKANKNRKRSKKEKDLISKRMRGNNYATGNILSKEQKIILSIANKNKILSKEHQNKLSVKNSKIILDIETGIFYKSIKEASELLDYNVSTLYGWLSGRYDNKTNLIYV